MRKIARILFLLLLAFVPPLGPLSTSPARAQKRHALRGMASWYGRAHHGRRTANGMRFNMFALTAAHKTLPFGTRVRVTVVGTDRSVEVEINDRGPYMGQRILDLSRAAASALGTLRVGVADVWLEILPRCPREPAAPVVEPVRTARERAAMKHGGAPPALNGYAADAAETEAEQRIYR